MTTRDARPVIAKQIGFDAYRSKRHARSGDTAWILILVAVLLGVFGVFLLVARAKAEGYSSDSSTLYVRVCSGKECMTVPISVDSCSAGGQAAMAEWLALHPKVPVKSWTCLTGVAA